MRRQSDDVEQMSKMLPNINNLPEKLNSELCRTDAEVLVMSVKKILQEKMVGVLVKFTYSIHILLGIINLIMFIS